MTRAEQEVYLLRELMKEQPHYWGTEIPRRPEERQMLLRALFNVRPPAPVSAAFQQVQDAYLQAVTEEKGVTDAETPPFIRPKICLWQGDITTLRTDAIVNAANDQLLGCFLPCHGCIDNAIHTFAGVQLRLACWKLMRDQEKAEKPGCAKITPGFNLPARYVLHTVGPVIRGPLTTADCNQLTGCYRSCLELAEKNRLESVAFCCISTGEFHFPRQEAAEIAVRTVIEFLASSDAVHRVIFNVFQDEDRQIYQKLLQG
ncbi:protein-ADP-ribose hydrolase [Clostridium sp. D33t1_170424_F3]|uniref:protein-ADP-ribose hydrolase n=1 Tax=Clostridium sp. D33t1_170424_F3 TaxID=2787099 RepID=UPI0018A8D80C|nr:protein-ADP-ribose hydrolase [Clostridium sp. D33t1_170424_F3]